MLSSDDGKKNLLPYSVEITRSSKNTAFYGLRFVKDSAVIYEFPEICDNFDAVYELLLCFEEFDVDQNHIPDIVSDFVQLLHCC